MGDEIALAKLVFGSYVKPIAVGGMLVGAGSTLWKMKDQLIGGVRRAFADIGRAGGAQAVERTSRDIDFKAIFIGVGLGMVAMFFLYYYFISHGSHGEMGVVRSVVGALVATLVMGFAGFVFAAVAGYLVGLIGSSNNPISGLTLSTLIVAALLLLVVGVKGDPGVTAVLGVAAVVCCACGVAGDMMQDLKVGHILGGTPRSMEIGEMIGVVFAAAVLTIPIIMLDKYGGGIGSEALPAPQAGLMAMLAKGIVGGQMAWPLVIVGMLMGIALLLIRAPAPMLIAVGMYLPFNTTAAIFCGGLLKIDHRLAPPQAQAGRGAADGLGEQGDPAGQRSGRGRGVDGPDPDGRQGDASRPRQRAALAGHRLAPGVERPGGPRARVPVLVHGDDPAAPGQEPAVIPRIGRRRPSRWEGVDVLALRPLPLVESRVRDGGDLLELLAPRFMSGPLGRWLQPRLRPERAHVRVLLDARGTAVWSFLDGRRNVGEVMRAYVAVHPDDAEQASERVWLFLAALERQRFVRFLAPD